MILVDKKEYLFSISKWDKATLKYLDKKVASLEGRIALQTFKIEYLDSLGKALKKFKNTPGRPTVQDILDYPKVKKAMDNLKTLGFVDNEIDKVIMTLPMSKDLYEPRQPSANNFKVIKK